MTWGHDDVVNDTLHMGLVLNTCKLAGCALNTTMLNMQKQTHRAVTLERQQHSKLTTACTRAALVLQSIWPLDQPNRRPGRASTGAPCSLQGR